jgi:hypothetical protein
MRARITARSGLASSEGRDAALAALRHPTCREMLGTWGEGGGASGRDDARPFDYMYEVAVYGLSIVKQCNLVFGGRVVNMRERSGCVRRPV